MKLALTNPSSFPLWIVLALALPGAVVVPLRREDFAPAPVLFHILVELITLAVVLILVLVMRRLMASSSYRWWMTIVLITVFGAIKGLLTWLMLTQAGIEEQTLLQRVVVAATVWGAFVPLAATLTSRVRGALSQNRELRAQLLELQTKYVSTKDQLDWLVSVKLQGISKDLAENFAELMSELNNIGEGPKGYKTLANKLAAAARQQVRPASLMARNLPGRNRVNFSKLINSRAVPVWAFLAYFLSTGFIVFVLSGYSIRITASAVAGIALLALLFISKLNPKLQLGAGALVGLVSSAALLMLGAPSEVIISQSLGLAIWSQTIVFAGMVVAYANHWQREQERLLANRLGEAASDLEWVEKQFAMKSIEVARYLHSVLQTRLMAYSLQLESGNISKDQIQEIIELLSNPMVDFGRQFNGLESELHKLQQDWQMLVDISVNLDFDPSEDRDQITLEIIQEAVANSIRHGLADQITIRVSESNNRMIEVGDDGIGLRSGRPGFGTDIFDSLAKQWKLVSNPGGGALLTAEV